MGLMSQSTIVVILFYGSILSLIKKFYSQLYFHKTLTFVKITSCDKATATVLEMLYNLSKFVLSKRSESGFFNDKSSHQLHVKAHKPIRSTCCVTVKTADTGFALLLLCVCDMCRHVLPLFLCTLRLHFTYYT